MLPLTSPCFDMVTHPNQFRLMAQQSLWSEERNVTHSLSLTTFQAPANHELGPKWNTIDPDFAPPQEPPQPCGTPLFFLLWNCKGAGRENFLRQALELVILYFPKLVVISQTCVRGTNAGHLSALLGFTNVELVDPLDSGGRMWLLWNSHELDCDNPVCQLTTHSCFRPVEMGA